MANEKEIIDLIKNSNEENIKGDYFHSEEYLNEIQFSDVMDIILIYIRLQPDMKNLGKIKSSKLYKLLKNEWKEWLSNEENIGFINLKSAWSNGIGPMDGSAGKAEIYMSYIARLNSYEYLLLFYCYPEELPGGWPEYRKMIMTMVLPKWKREQNLQKINLVFNLAEMICVAIRKEVAE
jgi:hypothetical protein